MMLHLLWGRRPGACPDQQNGSSFTTDTPSLRPQEPALSCSGFHSLAQQAPKPLPNSKCNPPSGPELAAGKSQTLNLLVGSIEAHRYGGVHSR
tara:strand:- start:121 stop:399 length:279 start_codon:yes stop_codon:yes gene_type:complete